MAVASPKAVSSPTSSTAASKNGTGEEWWWYVGGAAALAGAVALTMYAYKADKKQQKENVCLRHVLTEVEHSFNTSQKHIIRHIDTHQPWNKFDTVTLNAIYSNFQKLLDDPKCGLLNRTAFEKLMRLDLGVKDESVLSALYRVWDRNSDGHIDFVEFVHSLNDLVHSTSKERAHRLFRTFDLDANGSITRDELHKLLRTFVPGMDEKQRAAHVSTIMSGMDVNSDMRVSYTEFEKYCTDPLRGGSSLNQLIAGGFERQLLARFGVTPEHVKK